MASSICNSITSYENVHVGSCNQHLEIEIEIVGIYPCILQRTWLAIQSYRAQGQYQRFKYFLGLRLVSTHLLMVCINIATAHFFSSIATIENKIDTNYVSASPFSYLT